MVPVASVASVSVGFRGKELSFLGLSLLPSPTETLATQSVVPAIPREHHIYKGWSRECQGRRDQKPLK